MASPTPAVLSSAAAQQAAQSTLIGLMSDPLANALDGLDLSRVSSTLIDQLVLAVRSLAHRFGLASGTQAARYYVAERNAAGVRGSFSVRPAPVAPAAKVEASVKWATKGLWSKDPNIEATKVLVQGVAEKAILDAGRSTIINAVHADRKAKAWARIVEPGACSFCLLLATRGPVYRSEQTAAFLSHDHCRCHAQPVFGAYEPSAEVRRAQQIYRESTQGAHGPQATRLAFRQAIDAERSSKVPPGAGPH